MNFKGQEPKDSLFAEVQTMLKQEAHHNKQHYINRKF